MLGNHAGVGGGVRALSAVDTLRPGFGRKKAPLQYSFGGAGTFWRNMLAELTSRG